jgi:hypothetical protein
VLRSDIRRLKLLNDDDGLGFHAMAFERMAPTHFASDPVTLLYAHADPGRKFRFESTSESLLRLVEIAYGGLPRYQLPMIAARVPH